LTECHQQCKIKDHVCTCEVPSLSLAIDRTISVEPVLGLASMAMTCRFLSKIIFIFVVCDPPLYTVGERWA
jgi:hypothetical protein